VGEHSRILGGKIQESSVNLSGKLVASFMHQKSVNAVLTDFPSDDSINIHRQQYRRATVRGNTPYSVNNLAVNGDKSVPY
jgi:hypothetical protein